jgi:hypothetical protein
MRRPRANDTAVSQKTYLELDDVVPSWIGVIVAVDFHELAASVSLVPICCVFHQGYFVAPLSLHLCFQALIAQLGVSRLIGWRSSR